MNYSYEVTKKNTKYNVVEVLYTTEESNTFLVGIPLDVFEINETDTINRYAPKEIREALNQEKDRIIEDEIREERDEKLTKSDWVVIKSNELEIDVPEKWINYRQKLRDIPQQDEFPENVIWPRTPVGFE